MWRAPLKRWHNDYKGRGCVTRHYQHWQAQFALGHGPAHNPLPVCNGAEKEWARIVVVDSASLS